MFKINISEQLKLDSIYLATVSTKLDMLPSSLLKAMDFKIDGLGWVSLLSPREKKVTNSRKYPKC